VADANFISVIGETRILPETLEMTYARIKGALQSPASSRATEGQGPLRDERRE